MREERLEKAATRRREKSLKPCKQGAPAPPGIKNVKREKERERERAGGGGVENASGLVNGEKCNKLDG